jgi:hypothetical protein
VTSRISRSVGAQSFGCAHKGRVCVHVFTRVSVRACCECLRRKKKKLAHFQIRAYILLSLLAHTKTLASHLLPCTFLSCVASKLCRCASPSRHFNLLGELSCGVGALPAASTDMPQAVGAPLSTSTAGPRIVDSRARSRWPPGMPSGRSTPFLPPPRPAHMPPTPTHGLVGLPAVSRPSWRTKEMGKCCMFFFEKYGFNFYLLNMSVQLFSIYIGFNFFKYI